MNLSEFETYKPVTAVTTQPCVGVGWDELLLNSHCREQPFPSGAHTCVEKCPVSPKKTS